MGGIFNPGSGSIIIPGTDNIFDNDIMPRDEDKEKKIRIAIKTDDDLFVLPEQLYGTIKRVGVLNKKPILHGDPNLLKVGDLYFIDSAKQVYRYCGMTTKQVAQQRPTKKYVFETILPYEATEDTSFTIPEDERGLVHKVGILFNQIIYSGDVNLVPRGSFYYHDSLPFISTVGEEEGLINLATSTIDDNGDVVTTYYEYRVNPEPEPDIDYKSIPLTFKILSDGEVYLKIGMIKVNDGVWQEFRNKSVEVVTGDIVQFKDVDVTGPQPFEFTDCDINIYGNIMSLIDGEEFEEMTSLDEGIYFNSTFQYLHVVSAENLILPATELLISCYESMFNGCTSLTTAPELPASVLEEKCYKSMFYGCTSLNYIKMMATDISATNCLQYWVTDVAEEGTFVKNKDAEWTATGASGIPTGWEVVTAEA